MMTLRRYHNTDAHTCARHRGPLRGGPSTLFHFFFLIFYFSFLPVSAQVGTWRNYLAYHDVQQIQAVGDELFVRASNGLYQYNKTDQSITTYDKTNGLSDTGITLIRWCRQAHRLIAVYGNSNIDLIETNGRVTNISDIYAKAITGDKTINNITIDGQYAYLACGFGIVKLNVADAEITESYMLGFPVTAVAIQGNAIYARGNGGNGTWTAPLTANLIDKSSWHRATTALPSFADDTTDYDQNIQLVSTLNPGGPKYNYFGFMRFKHDRLYTCGGGYNAYSEMVREGTVQILHDGQWTVLPDNMEELTGWRYRDVLCVDAAPNDPNHIFAGGQTGLYEFQDNVFRMAYNLDNSPLESTLGDRKHWVIVGGLTFDNDGNLFMLNRGAPTQSLIELTHNGQWVSHNRPEFMLSETSSLQGIQMPFIDSRGLLWFVNYHWNKPSIFCYDSRQQTVVNSFFNLKNQDNTSIMEYYDPMAVAEDLEGNIWVCTKAGPLVIEKDNIYTQGTYVTQIKVPRNDGTNYADYLLDGISVLCMAIDGGGRKWFGTRNNGVYLISDDNMTQIHHFTASNSPLLSDNIESIAINNKTGEVFFGTNKGLCSYMSDATQTHEEMTTDNVYAYPNPVTPDYTGLITVTGLSYNADVKILNAYGKLIREGRSNGGTFTWDGCDSKGKRVSSGVYFVATATSSGNKGCVCKIAVIK